MTSGQAFEELLSLMARLRGENGCPWDRAQTQQSLRPHVIEEAYELVEAISQGRPDSVREELGDLLLEVVFLTQIATEEGAFSMPEVIGEIQDKLVRRHPHVFSDVPAATRDEALARWEDVKSQEKPGRKSVLDGVPRSFPALTRAQKLTSRAAQNGFDWRSSADVRAKLDEELEELDGAIATGDGVSVEEELGDLLFVIVNLARHLGVEAEVALTGSSDKFVSRLRLVENELRGSGRSLREATLEELDELWEQAKRKV
ncbi:MAG TPA: nucleoside triphosphate pyrophosphohydrolase [Vicinamibacteria bacterium]|nr:nucleoside triphosphate pyrophosphohydrolase [Vicinamibacteria bacterium]